MKRVKSKSLVSSGTKALNISPKTISETTLDKHSSPGSTSDSDHKFVKGKIRSAYKKKKNALAIAAASKLKKTPRKSGVVTPAATPGSVKRPVGRPPKSGKKKESLRMHLFDTSPQMAEPKKRDRELDAEDSENMEAKRVRLEETTENRKVFGERNIENSLRGADSETVRPDTPNFMDVTIETTLAGGNPEVLMVVQDSNHNEVLATTDPIPATPVTGMARTQEQRTPGSILKRREGDVFSPKTNSSRRVHFDWNGEEEEQRASPSTPLMRRPSRARQSLIASLDALDAKCAAKTIDELAEKPEEVVTDGDFKHIYPKLVSCSKPAASICKELMEPSASYAARTYFAAKKIKTVGDLARLSKRDISKMPFVVPKVATLKERLDLIMKGEMQLIQKDIPPQSQSLLLTEAAEKSSSQEFDQNIAEVSDEVIVLSDTELSSQDSEVIVSDDPSETTELVKCVASDHHQSLPMSAEAPSREPLTEEMVEETPVGEEEEDEMPVIEEDHLKEVVNAELMEEADMEEHEDQLEPGPIEAPPAPHHGGEWPEAEPARTAPEAKAEEIAEVSFQKSVYAGIQLVGPVWTQSFEAIRDLYRSGPFIVDGVSEFVAAARESMPKQASASLGQMSYEELVNVRRVTRDAFFAVANLVDDEFQKYERKLPSPAEMGRTQAQQETESVSDVNVRVLRSRSKSRAPLGEASALRKPPPGSPVKVQQRTPMKRRSSDKENGTPIPARSTCVQPLKCMYLDMDAEEEEQQDLSLSPPQAKTLPANVEETPKTKAMMNQLQAIELNSVKKTPTRTRARPKAAKTLESTMKDMKLSSGKKLSKEEVDRPSTSTRSARRSLFNPNDIKKERGAREEGALSLTSSEEDSSDEEPLAEIDESDHEDDCIADCHRSIKKTPKKMLRSKATSRVRNVSKDLGVSPKKKLKTETKKLKPNTLAWVRSQLCAAVVPDRLPCREDEYRHIETFFKNATVSNGQSQSMYISGVPGTGKTATVLQVARMLRDNPKFPKFNFVRVNAMELADPKNFFLAVYTQLFPDRAKKRIALGTARRKLNDMFLYKDANRLPVVLLVDELDLLCTKRQDIIYDLFNWSAVAESRVNVIAIANTLDLPERALTLRITSRIGFNRLTFQPYEFAQISSILQDRLQGAKCISKDALQLASRKVASISGDLRKALDIVKRAVEIAIELGSASLELKHVQSAIEEAKFAYRSELVAALSSHEKTIVEALLELTISTRNDEIDFELILRRYRDISRNKGVAPLSATAAYACALRLCNCGLLKTDNNGNLGWLYRTMRLVMSPEDLRCCFNLQKDSS
ncbi:hypothetical protein QR680_008975 [Steinernema hermaphroditum]|uniref:AAA+ ATPase domain-containing protein n=1 Tax=Steinernema hermaphroditum TaxID=289476 RepID=A0AA39IIK8_9BILA|nr:hypothetical protein QR680_008975 [Steinernema hermaphroditum]